jgi:predicted AAA+ superfamily ATPase
MDIVRGLLKRHPVVAIIGARQVGKTTLAKHIAQVDEGPVTTFDLEDPADLARLSEPTLVLRDLRGLVVLDEIQRRPDLFPVLRVLCDRPDVPIRFLILGSASPGLLRQSSESLAGRIAHHLLSGFAVDEVGAGSIAPLWLRGGFPRSFLADSDGASAEWRREFVKTFVERDLPQLGITISSTTLRRFWAMLAHYHGQVMNLSEFARSFGVSDTSIRRYLDLLSATFVVRQLTPWFESIKKRQVKSPKVYITDSGLLHTLLNLEGCEELESHPKVGASWEGFAMRVLTTHIGARPEECFFWATHAGAELDLLVMRGNRRLGFEFKRTDAPTTTRSMRVALEDLKLERIDVVHAGEQAFPLAERIRAVPLSRVLEVVEPLP